MSNEIYQTLGDLVLAEQNEPWKALDMVCRKWATMSGFEKDAQFYEKLKEISQKTRPKWQD